MLLVHFSSVARVNRMWDLWKTWHLFENGSARMRELLVPGFLDNQLQDENLAPFWGGSGKPAPKKGSAEFLKKEGEGRRQETQIWHRR